MNQTEKAVFISDAALEQLALPTPFYLYDEAGIRSSCRELLAAFSWNAGFRAFFPVKATPTAAILRLLREEGMGVVCSSAPELLLAERCGFSSGEILFAPNYPLPEDTAAAAGLHAGVILDGPYLMEPFRAAGCLQAAVGLRYNPGGQFSVGGKVISIPENMKFGFTRQQALDAAVQLQAAGVSSVGLHGYMCGNVLEPGYYAAIAESLCGLAAEMHRKTGVKIGFINISGGLGLAYRPGEQAPDLQQEAAGVQAVYKKIMQPAGLGKTPLYAEPGRILTGPHGILVSRVLYARENYRKYIGIDACAANLMRPMLYGAYHHISVVGKAGVEERELYDVVGSVAENTDRMTAEPRLLPPAAPGDLLVIHDVGAHGHSMGYNYGGKLRSAEYLWQMDGTARMIRRAETAEDYLATQIF